MLALDIPRANLCSMSKKCFCAWFTDLTVICRSVVMNPKASPCLEAFYVASWLRPPGNKGSNAWGVGRQTNEVHLGMQACCLLSSNSVLG